MLRRSICVLLLLTTMPIYALVDFYGYRGYIPKNDSVTRYSQTLLGYAELEISEIAVVPCGVYLDITEDAWISSDVNKLTIEGLTGDYLYRGTIPVPQEATVTGLQTWRGERMYRAALRESKYIVDARFDDSITLQQSLDSRIALLQQHTETAFEITLTRVALGERVHVRIRYLLKPADAKPGAYSFPVLFHTTHGNRPLYIKFTIAANDNDQIFKINGSAGQLLLDDTMTTMLPYEPTLNLQRSTPLTSSLNLTEFTSGTYSGNYLAVNTGVTDSIVGRLSKPIATVFVWRWNGPQPMTTYNEQIKTLSDYAWTVIEQAGQLRATITELHKLGNSCALIHSIEGSTGYAFSSSGINTLSDSSAITYLQSINEMELFEKYRDEPADLPDWVVEENGNATVIQKARDDFLKALNDARSLIMKNGKTDFRHIVMVTAGGAEDSYLKDISESVSPDFDNITICHESVLWRGVDVGASLTGEYSLFPWGNYSFPAFSPVTIQLTVENADQPFSFPQKKSSWNSALTFTARTSAAWDTTLAWTGFDAEGKLTRTISERPQVYQYHADSGLAKLWAGDHSHIAEKEEIYPGGTFGILTKATFLQATTGNIAEDVSQSIPFLTDDEILAPRSMATQEKARASAAGRSATLYIVRGDLHILSHGRYTTLKVFDLQGRLLLQLDLASYVPAREKAWYIIPLSKLLKGRHLSMLIVQLSGRGTGETFHLMNGRVQ